MSLDILQGNHCRLLHDVAQVARQRQFARLALRQRGLDEQYLTAHAGPCQSCHHTSIGIALIDIAIEGRLAQQVFNLCWRDLVVGQLAIRGISYCHLAQGFVDLFFQLAHTALAGVLFNHLFYGSLVEG